MEDDKKIIVVKDLQKVFRVPYKQVGFLNKWKALFKPVYKEVEAVSSLSFSVEKWEKVAFLGPNGAWKSTTIKMLTWILQPTGWEMSILWYNPSKQRKKLVYQIGAVFWQTSRLWYHLTPMDTFFIMGQLFDVPKKELEERITYLVETFEIKNIVDMPVRKLSLGQRMRCEIVASLLHNPKVIFLDEPTIGLDIIAKQKLRETINEINKKEGVTIFLTSHDLWDVEQVCERVVVINHGTILYDGSLEHLRKEYIKTKTIKVNLVWTEEFHWLPFMDVQEKQMDYVQFTIPNTKEAIAETFAYLTSHYQIEDIEIKDPTIEEIIKQFY